MTLPLQGDGVDGVELTIAITLRRLGQYKTAWPAVKTTLLQARAPGVSPADGMELEKVRAMSLG